VPHDVTIKGSLPLGLLPELSGHSHHFTLDPGEWIVLFTDGLLESFNAEHVPLERAGIARLLSRPFTTADQVVDALNFGELQHRGGATPHDDLTLLVFGFR
jgi:sigma-B regulation protein RsbU (phosphoserine phosphatase)